MKGASDTPALLRLLRPRVYIPLNNAEFDQASEAPGWGSAMEAPPGGSQPHLI